MKNEKPRVNGLILQVVENQLRDGNPPEAGQTLERLIGEGFSAEDAKHLIGTAIVAEMHHVLQSSKPFNAERYVELLIRLPQVPSST